LESKKLYRNYFRGKMFLPVFGITDYRYLCRSIQCKGRREVRASLRREGNVEGPESVLFPLGPCEKGLSQGRVGRKTLPR
jgi:hypothetical protein